MRSSAFALAAACAPSCLGLAVGDPSRTARRQVATCDLPKCQSVQDQAGCIESQVQLGGGSVDALVGCVAGNDKSLLCSCGGCVDGLLDYLSDNSVC